MNLAEQLKTLWASNFQAYTISHGYHVNLTGDDFFEYHTLFGDIYDYLQDNIDTQAELIRQLDEIVPFSAKRIAELTEIKDVEKVPDIPTMVTDIDEMLYTLIDLANDVIETSAADKEWGLNNYACQYVQDLNKFCWMLRASSQGVQDN